MTVRQLDKIDKAIVVATQAGLPLVPRPYQTISAEVGVPAADVVARLARMLEDGIIRRVGVVPNHYALGLTRNAMTVWDVNDDEVGRLGREIGGFDFVTHCYRRPRRLPLWPYNLFAMVHGTSDDEIEAKISRIAVLLGDACSARDVLVSSRILKKSGLRIAA